MRESLALLRDRATDTAGFRAASEQIGESLIQEMHELLRKNGAVSESIRLVIILRSGVALLAPALHTFPGAPVGVLGMKRGDSPLVPHM